MSGTVPSTLVFESVPKNISKAAPFQDSATNFWKGFYSTTYSQIEIVETLVLQNDDFHEIYETVT